MYGSLTVTLFKKKILQSINDYSQNPSSNPGLDTIHSVGKLVQHSLSPKKNLTNLGLI